MRELRGLLDGSGVGRPFVLVGHSAGGLYVREYALEHPEDVAGIVLIESSSPQQIDELPGFRASYEEDKRDAHNDLWMDRPGRVAVGSVSLVIVPFRRRRLSKASGSLNMRRWLVDQITWTQMRLSCPILSCPPAVMPLLRGGDCRQEIRFLKRCIE